MSETGRFLDERSGSRRRRHVITPSESYQSIGSLAVITAITLVLFGSFLALMFNMRQTDCHRKPYNATSIARITVLEDGSHQYEIAVVTDLDMDSRDKSAKNQWHSFMRHGTLTINNDQTKATVEWRGNEITLYSTLSAGGRSMELSDLVVFDGHLLSIDDRTGIIYRIDNHNALPWVILADGAGDTAKGFKGEWMTVKDGELWVGGLGKEWTTTEGVFVNDNPMWVKRVANEGRITHVNWIDNYKKLRSAIGIEWPGYVIHESAQWSDVCKKWFFLPRRASNLQYTEAEDEHRGTNYLLVASEDFSTIESHRIGESRSDETRGFSAFQFIPGSNDRLIVALKSEEKNGTPVASYITVFEHETGRILLDEQPLIGKFKYEGIAFV